MSIDKTDISMNVDDELIDLFINDEYLNDFASNVNSFAELEEMAHELFYFNNDQFNNFREYFNAGSFND